MAMIPGLVSILVPCHGAGKFIREMLESVRSQTYADWELIAVDDCGPADGTRDAIEAFAREQPDNVIRYVKHETNRGVSIARRTALTHARGEFIGFLDADDAYLPQKLDRSIELLRSNADVVFVHGPARTMNGPAPATKGGVAFYMGDRDYRYWLAGRDDFLQRCNICNSTVVCRVAAIRPADFATGMIFQNEDWVLWNRLARRGATYYHADPLTLYRYHPESFSFRADRQPGTWELAQLEMLACSMGNVPDFKTRAAIGREIMGCMDRLSYHRTVKCQNGSTVRATTRRCLVSALLTHLPHDVWRLLCRFVTCNGARGKA